MSGMGTPVLTRLVASARHGPSQAKSGCFEPNSRLTGAVPHLPQIAQCTSRAWEMSGITVMWVQFLRYW